MLNNQVDKTKNRLVLPVVSIIGQEKEFHAANAVKMITVKVVARTMGMATLKKKGKVPTPSIIAASLVRSEILAKALRYIKAEKVDETKGKIIAAMTPLLLCFHCNLTTIWY